MALANRMLEEYGGVAAVSDIASATELAKRLGAVAAVSELSSAAELAKKLGAGAAVVDIASAAEMAKRLGVGSAVSDLSTVVEFAKNLKTGAAVVDVASTAELAKRFGASAAVIAEAERVRGWLGDHSSGSPLARLGVSDSIADYLKVEGNASRTLGADLAKLRSVAGHANEFVSATKPARTNLSKSRPAEIDLTHINVAPPRLGPSLVDVLQQNRKQDEKWHREQMAVAKRLAELAEENDRRTAENDRRASENDRREKTFKRLTLSVTIMLGLAGVLAGVWVTLVSNVFGS